MEIVIFVFSILALASLNYHFSRNKSGRDSNSEKRKTPRKNDYFYNPKRSFVSAADAGEYGELLLQDELRRLKGRVINGYITSTNIVYENQNFEIDFLIMVPKVGFVVAEVKYYSGEVYCTNNREWKQVKNGSSELIFFRNASKQVLRTRALLKKLLAGNSIDKWPIKPVVVFVHPTARIFKAKNDRSPQTDVIKIEMLEKWLQELPKRDNISFSRSEFQKIYYFIKKYEKKFCAT